MQYIQRPHPFNPPWYLLPRRNQHPLLLRIMLPPPSSRLTTMFLRIASHSLLQLGPEMSDEALQGPGEGFTECCMIY